VDDTTLALSGIVVLTFSKGVQDLDIIALIPPMGASLLACVVENLVVCGVDAIFLACAAWSLGPPIRFNDTFNLHAVNSQQVQPLHRNLSATEQTQLFAKIQDVIIRRLSQ
jgi:hypothetical protein